MKYQPRSAYEKKAPVISVGDLVEEMLPLIAGDAKGDMGIAIRVLHTANVIEFLTFSGIVKSASLSSFKQIQAIGTR